MRRAAGSLGGSARARWYFAPLVCSLRRLGAAVLLVARDQLGRELFDNTGTSPPAGPTPPPGPTTATIPSAGGNVVLPALNGQAATLIFGAGAPAGTTITATETATPPAGAPVPSSLRRVSSFAGAAPFFFVRFNTSSDVPLSTLTGEAVTLSGAIRN